MRWKLFSLICNTDLCQARWDCEVGYSWYLRSPKWIMRKQCWEMEQSWHRFVARTGKFRSFSWLLPACQWNGQLYLALLKSFLHYFFRDSVCSRSRRRSIDVIWTVCQYITSLLQQKKCAIYLMLRSPATIIMFVPNVTVMLAMGFLLQKCTPLS